MRTMWTLRIGLLSCLLALLQVPGPARAQQGPPPVRLLPGAQDTSTPHESDRIRAIVTRAFLLDDPDCPYVILEVTSEKVIGKGDAGEGVVLKTGERVVFERDCWWHFEGS